MKLCVSRSIHYIVWLTISIQTTNLLSSSPSSLLCCFLCTYRSEIDKGIIKLPQLLCKWQVFSKRVYCRAEQQPRQKSVTFCWGKAKWKHLWALRFPEQPYFTTLQQHGKVGDCHTWPAQSSSLYRVSSREQTGAPEECMGSRAVLWVGSTHEPHHCWQLLLLLSD